MSADRPRGEPVSSTPARRPERTVLSGDTVRLEPLDPARHGEQLYAASHGPDVGLELWDYLFVGPFADQERFAAWLESAAGSNDPLFFAVVDEASGVARGMVSYLRITPEHQVIEIGNIWFGPAIQRTRQSTNAIYLLARHVFDELNYRRLEWKCDALNAPSRRAAERLGFNYEGIFRQHMIVKGHNRDTAWYAMLDREWPLVREAFERWLDPANFDEGGGQRQSLTSIRESLR